MYLYNRTPHRTIENQTHIELLNGIIPSITHLHTFGCKVYTHIPSETRPSGSKLLPRAVEGIFVGYTGSSNIFRIYLPKKQTVEVTRQVVFPGPKSGEVTVNLPQFLPSSNIPPSQTSS